MSSMETEEQLVVFRLGEESYAVGIEAVSTIIRMPEITYVPHAAPHVQGVINLRGIILPVLDLRTCLGLAAEETTKTTRVIVVENAGGLVGMIVDAVTETLRITKAQVETLSTLVTSVDAGYLRGVAKVDDRLIILLALDRVLQQADGGVMHDEVMTSAVLEPVTA